MRVSVSPDIQVQDVGALEKEGVEGDRQGMRVETPEAPPVRNMFRDERANAAIYPDRMSGRQRASGRLPGGGGGDDRASPPGGGGGVEREEGRPGPPQGCFF